LAKIHIYCPRRSDSAMTLVHALEAKRLRRFDGENFWDKGKRVKTEDGDAIICWGTHLPELDGLKVLNSMDKRLDKYDQAVKLGQSGVSTVRVFDPKNVNDIPTFIKAGYLFRSKSHVGGSDLLGLERNPQLGFFTEKVDFAEEVRIHSFAERSIRAGKKIPRDGFTAVTKAVDWRPNAGLLHPWVRSYDGGWKISYDGFKSTDAMRAIAHAAVKALGLTFGAVDIGITKDNRLVVLEVNTAPGIEGGTLHSYVRAINRWLGVEKPKKDE
jgi:hypothetical protein